MNVIPPYGRPALIQLVTSMDDSEKEFASIPIVWMELQDPKGTATFPAKLPSYTVSLTLKNTPCWTQARIKFNRFQNLFLTI